MEAIDKANDLFDTAIQKLEGEENFDPDNPPTVWDQLNDFYDDGIKLKAKLSTQPCWASALPSLGLVLREEGPRALYKGFVPKVLCLRPGGGILLVVFKTVSGYMRKHFM
ncbi:uncharacterized protein EV422DRAFT_570242 [Fimicolochytrium jonesii]|uniref:uncharacterized protein n=1 Tax=Fimicolochytrium jonesii TaxID=1396493 RepID=UPI0022FEFD99|nr:uncharacterized protein EV422DRAFT_570242 [Fimicolochytrium jonesii]KAI8817778.1 hypothetical protein EV422DRAFT_570242 [Fimicolochytrium jonesii]